MTLNYDDSSSRAKNIFKLLVSEAHRYPSPDDFVNGLVSQITEAACTTRDLEYAVGAIRAALGVHLKRSTKDTADRCNFCGKPADDVWTLLASSESTICDECILTAVDMLSRKPRRFLLRLRFAIFLALTPLRRILSSSRGAPDHSPPH